MKTFCQRFIHSQLDIVVLRLCIVAIFLVYGIAKWFEFEVQALKPLFAATWLAILPTLFGDHGASYFLGIVEGIAYLSLLMAFFKPTAGIIGDVIVILTAIVTLSLLPQLGKLDGFIFKDLLLIGGGLVLLKHDLAVAMRVNDKKSS